VKHGRRSGSEVGGTPASQSEVFFTGARRFRLIRTTTMDGDDPLSASMSAADTVSCHSSRLPARRAKSPLLLRLSMPLSLFFFQADAGVTAAASPSATTDAATSAPAAVSVCVCACGGEAWCALSFRIHLISFFSIIHHSLPRRPSPARPARPTAA